MFPRKVVLIVASELHDPNVGTLVCVSDRIRLFPILCIRFWLRCRKREYVFLTIIGPFIKLTIIPWITIGIT